MHIFAIINNMVWNQEVFDLLRKEQAMIIIDPLNKALKGVVFLKKTFADNLLSPMSSKMSMSFFLQLKRN